MSFRTWCDEFYPKPARYFAVCEDTLANNIEAIKHSIAKWEGAKPENLAKHGVAPVWYKADTFVGVENPHGVELAFNAGTCALCKMHVDEGCVTCPLYRSRGGVACDQDDEDDNGIFQRDVYHLATHGEPQAMIDALKKALEMLERQADQAADEKHLAQMLDGAESDDERQAITKAHYGT